MRVEGTYRARLPSFVELRALAEAFGQSVRADPEATIRVVLVLEELFTNTVAHGYPAGSEGPVWVSLGLARDAIEIVYEDACPPFDPIGGAPPAPRSAAEQTLGGVGLALVRGLSASARYARVGDRNRVVLTVATRAAASPPAAAP
jgi:serine/threonine-protein kinase RsbW